MFTLYFVAFYFVFSLRFIFSFISHPSYIIIIVHIFISYPRFSLTLCLFLTKRGRVSSREYQSVFVISIWLFWCMIKLLTCFTSCLFDRNLIVTLYLSFYYMLYLEGLMCFVQVFQVTNIYVPSASQLLIILKGRNFKYF